MWETHFLVDCRGCPSGIRAAALKRQWPPAFPEAIGLSDELEDDPAFELESPRAAIAREAPERGRGRRIHDGDSLGLCHREVHVVQHVEAIRAEDELEPLRSDVEATLQRGIHVIAAGLTQIA